MVREPHFYFFGVPVFVEPFHWLVSAVFGVAIHGFTLSALIWVLLVFVGVLCHELGHALVGRRFGQEPIIVLSGWGGFTAWLHPKTLSAGQQILVSFAGPAVGLVLGGSVWLWSTHASLPPSPVFSRAVSDFIWVNLGWAIFNLIPVFPLDGGQISKAIFERFLGLRGLKWAHLFSMALAIGLALLALPMRAYLLVLVFGQLAILNWSHFQASHRWVVREGRPFGNDESDTDRLVAREAARTTFRAELQRGWQALEDRRPALVRSIAESLLVRAENDDQRYEVLHMLAWGRLLDGDPEGALRAIRELPSGKAPDALLEGSIRLELGDAKGALPLLAEGIRGRGDDFVAIRLAKAVALTGDIRPVLELLAQSEVAKEIGPRAFQVIFEEVFRSKRYLEAAELGKALFERFQQGRDAFNVACALGRAAKSHEALEWLERAIDAGLEDPSVLDTDADLSSLRMLPEFQSLRQRAGLS
ncbi:MAG: site-2 protease family protein [Sandaracinaceae bacterium]|nr:site-2 protease family protein [Sandaracinaceae bacterium]